MPYKLFHKGFELDDQSPWCPVCYDLDYQNIKASVDGGEPTGRAAHPMIKPKGPVDGYQLWWRHASDLGHMVDKNGCKFCAALLKVIDSFWNDRFKGVAQSSQVLQIIVGQDGSVELRESQWARQTPFHVELYTPSGHDLIWGRLPLAPQISRSGRCERARAFLDQKLDSCNRDHELCKQQQVSTRVLPTRVLDVGEGDISGSSTNLRLKSASPAKLKLHEPEVGAQDNYVALSYCWGDGNHVRTTKSNLSQMKEAIDEDRLPATIRDAIEITRHVGVRYLWVDALCIVQDDVKDWEKEAAQMSSVYGNSFLTISAAAVKSSDMSFLDFSSRATTGREVLIPIEGNMLGARPRPMSGFHETPHDPIVDPTMFRAWTLQEHLLSSRAITFSRDELQWLCPTCRACECGYPEDEHDSKRPETLTRELKGTAENDSEELRAEGDDRGTGENENTNSRVWEAFQPNWHHLLRMYTRRRLTNVHDALPAFSGIARAYMGSLKEATRERGGGGGSGRIDTTDKYPSNYAAGLWTPILISGLMWIWSGSYMEPKDDSYIAPTWSWASINISGHREIYNWNVPNPLTTLVSLHCTLATPDDPFGRITREGTHVRLRGVVLEVEALVPCNKEIPWTTITTDEKMKIPGSVYMDGLLEAARLPSSSEGGDEPSGEEEEQEEDIQPPPPRTLRRRRFQSPNEVIHPDACQRARERYENPDKEKFRMWVLYLGNGTYGDKRRYFTLLLTKSSEEGTGYDDDDDDVYERVGMGRVHFPQDGDGPGYDIAPGGIDHVQDRIYQAGEWKTIIIV